jgi:rRNA maturation endonuclease Nob1
VREIQREIQRVRQRVRQTESERVLTERDIDVGKAGHTVVGELAGGARLMESWPVVRV